jgi:FKBP-type peptidyl-prolyl cis-trans isomerase
MKSIFLCLLILISQALLAQSKKELIAEVNSMKAQIEELKKPVEVDLGAIDRKASYGLGILVATNIKNQGADSINLDALVAGMKDILLNKTPKMEQQECMMVVQQYMKEVSERKNQRIKTESQVFLETNKTKPGVIVTPSGLQYRIISSGAGKAPGPNDNVTVHYTGKIVDGTVFDSSVERGTPATFVVNAVIPGWTEALQLMHEGDKWELFIPNALGYGERGAGAKIPPFSTLIFEVELIKVN